MASLFISAERLEAWSAEERVSVDGAHMTLNDVGRVFEIRPAVHFLGVVGGDADPHNLVGLVVGEDALVKMGADHMASSVIYVETAYEVQNGFVGVPLPK